MSLSQDIAKARAAIIRPNSINYNYNIVLNTEDYTGLAQITFYIDNPNFIELEIDFSSNGIQSIQVNFVDFPIPTDIQNFVIFPRKYLQKGRNYVSILYTNQYDTDGLGCVTFQDGDLQYVYTQFQTYGANRIFPCFDQPDLKANMKLSLVTPSDWTALSNQPPISPPQAFDLAKLKSANQSLASSKSQSLLDLFSKKVGDDTILTTFDTTDLLPTYVFGFSAGILIRIDPNEPNSSAPLAIYSVASSATLVYQYSAFIFDVTQKAMAYFQQNFQVKYPFKKYDQVFLRELDFWAMENAGMVTLDAGLLIKTDATSLDKYNLANTVVHELAHHWFGNYVTMQWWNDVWLNESFAEFIAYYTLQKINNTLNQPLQPPNIYFRDTKYYGYIEDQRNRATHSISGPVADTSVADSVFDGITYNKGAAVLKQLFFLIGETPFYKALASYFTAFAWSNATIDDLLEKLAPSFPSSLNITIQQWKVDWLQTPSLNVLEAIWDPTKKTTTQTLSLYQSAYRSTDSNLRSHTLQVAFFDQTGALVSSQPVNIDKKITPTVLTYDGSKNIAAILVNYNDYAYLQNYMDHISLQFFMANILKVADDSTRSLIWYNISSLVRQTIVSVTDFTNMILVNLFEEPVDFILDQMLEQNLTYLDQYASEDLAVQLGSQIFDKIYDTLKNGGLTLDNSDRIQVLYKQYIDYAQTDAQKIKLNELLQDLDLTNVSSVVQVDDQLCWEIVKKIFSISNTSQLQILDDQKWAIFEYMASLDKSYRTDEARQICGAILATDLQYDQLYAQLLIPGIDLNTRYLYAQGLTNQYNFDRYNNSYRERYFNDIISPFVYFVLSYSEYQLFYTQLRPRDQDYADQLVRYQQVLATLQAVPGLEAHCINIKKIIDDINMSIVNNQFSADSNLTLTQIRANQRADYITGQSVSYLSNVAYTDLNGVNSTYQGYTEVTFSLNTLPKLLPLDFAGSQIVDLVVNGYSIIQAQIDQFLVIPRIYLKIGPNTIAVHYVNYYNNDGLGCMGYIDKSSGSPSYYTYTQFEPYSAHRFIPCFDQPNLKAPASFNVIVPAAWMAAGNNPSTSQGIYDQTTYTSNVPKHQYPNLLNKFLTGKVGNYYVFGATLRISTYLYCVIAGQYYSKTATSAQLYNGIPMTIYSLQSYQPNLDLTGDFIFNVTTQALKFFEQKFQVNYPFSKYDTVFCHEYKFGAMQNPGLITFTDTYLYGEVVSVTKYAKLAVTIAHECAHNWFGNYVTMDWWDDLWLNESFADFISYFCIENIRGNVPELQGLTSAWLSGQQRTVGGYREDQNTTTTHPIRSTVTNTSLALQYFDGITYQKGSMVLKQLMFLISQNSFFLGLTSYFDKYKFSNATIDDFLAEMEPYFNQSFSLDQWKNSWILTPSLNVISVEWDPSSRSSSAILVINQSSFTPVYDQLRFHIVNVAFFDQTGNYNVQKVLIQNTPQTLVTYDASNGVTAILVNQDHQDFMKYRFDDTSETFFINNLSNITNPLTRMIIYFYLNEQIRDGYLEKRVLDYRDAILPELQTETQDIVFQFQLKFLNTATRSYLRSDLRSDARTPLFDFVLTSLQSFGQYWQKIQKLKLKRQRQNYAQKSKLQSLSGVFSSRMTKPFHRKPELRSVKILADVNRITILKDLLPVFCDPQNATQAGVLKDWLDGVYTPLLKYTITESQAWEVIKIIFASSLWTTNQKNTIFGDFQLTHVGVVADLTHITCQNLVADPSELETTYTTYFKKEDYSITVKTYAALGWNNSVHSDLLLTEYKPRIFADMIDLSNQLSSEHFMFFYTNLQPIDDKLQDTIDLYKQVLSQLTGSDKLGHINNIKKIISELENRSNLYLINAPGK